MGVFHALQTDGSSATANSLSEKLGVERIFLVRCQLTQQDVANVTHATARLMRMLTVMRPFAEVGKEEYAHTPYSLIYLVPALQSAFTAS